MTVESSTGGLVYKAWYEQHPDADLKKLMWPANPRNELSKVAEWHKRFPGGFVPLSPEAGLEKFFEFKYGKLQDAQDEGVK